jgi:hypothetical protein
MEAAAEAIPALLGDEQASPAPHNAVQPGVVPAVPEDTLGGAAAVQPTYVDVSVQTIEKIDAGVQCEPPVADSEELRRQLSSPALAKFLCRAVPLCEQALQQNELADVLQDEFAGEAVVVMPCGQTEMCNTATPALIHMHAASE